MSAALQLIRTAQAPVLDRPITHPAGSLAGPPLGLAGRTHGIYRFS